jgi:hypothetical protein
VPPLPPKTTITASDLSLQQLQFTIANVSLQPSDFGSAGTAGSNAGGGFVQQQSPSVGGLPLVNTQPLIDTAFKPG